MAVSYTRLKLPKKKNYQTFYGINETEQIFLENKKQQENILARVFPRAEGNFNAKKNKNKKINETKITNF